MVDAKARFRALLSALQVKLGVKKGTHARVQVFDCVLHLYAHEVSTLSLPLFISSSFYRQPSAASYGGKAHGMVCPVRTIPRVPV